MSEVELYLIQEGENCTIYTLQFLRDSESEFEIRVQVHWQRRVSRGLYQNSGIHKPYRPGQVLQSVILDLKVDYPIRLLRFL